MTKTGHFDFDVVFIGAGFGGCRDRLPHLQRLADQTGDALSALEAAAAGNAPALVGERA